MKLAVVAQNGSIKKESLGENQAFLGYTEAYSVGDQIELSLETTENYLMVRLDGTLNETLLYVPGNTWRYLIPTDTQATAYHPAAFQGERHYVSARYAEEAEKNRYQNLSLNTHDQKEASGAYPHASANVETRNDTTFFARNAIDGILANEDHGSYPYQSWGINQDPNACLRISFGRLVSVDQLRIVLRGDFPHDSYWTQGTVTFSDGSQEILSFEKTLESQNFTFQPKEIDWLEFHELKKAEDESPFPALTQLSVFGRNL